MAASYPRLPRRSRRTALSRGVEGHRAILCSRRGTDWRFQAAGGVRVVRPTANNGVFIRDAALARLGVVLVPSFIVPQELRSGALKALNVGYEPDAPTSIARTPARPYLIGEAPRSRASPLSLRQSALLGNSSRRGARVKLLHRRLEGRPINPLCSQVSWQHAALTGREIKCGNRGEEQMRAGHKIRIPPSLADCCRESSHRRVRRESRPRALRMPPIAKPFSCWGWPICDTEGGAQRR
jgi:hypothetical protein